MINSLLIINHSQYFMLYYSLLIFSSENRFCAVIVNDIHEGDKH